MKNKIKDLGDKIRSDIEGIQPSYSVKHYEIMTEWFQFICTVWMNEMPRFYVGKLLLYQYKSDLDHTSDRCSSVIEL